MTSRPTGEPDLVWQGKYIQVKKLGTWWEWSELFFGNGFDLSMHRRDCTDAVWAATLAANKGPGQWYADADSLRYSFFDKVESDD